MASSVASHSSRFCNSIEQYGNSPLYNKFLYPLNFIIAKSGDATGAWRYIGKVFATGEPITTAPSVAPACDGNGWNVAFGTGKLNEDIDYADTAQRGFYNVIDRGISSALTVNSTDIVNIPYTTTTAGASTVRNWTTPNLTGKLGWKMLFSGGERVLSNSTLPPDTGNVLFGTTKPTGNVLLNAA